MGYQRPKTHQTFAGLNWAAPREAESAGCEVQGKAARFKACVLLSPWLDAFNDAELAQAERTSLPQAFLVVQSDDPELASSRRILRRSAADACVGCFR